jgi:hypothetical protein
MTGVAAHPQEAVLEMAAFNEILKFLGTYSGNTVRWAVRCTLIAGSYSWTKLVKKLAFRAMARLYTSAIAQSDFPASW